MNILHVNTLYPPIVVGGAEISVSTLAEAQASEGHRVDVISIHQGAEYVTEQIRGVTVHRLPVKGEWLFDRTRSAFSKFLWHFHDTFMDKHYETLSRLLSELKPDILHTHNLTGLSLAPWHVGQRQGIPIIHTPRDYSLICPRASMFRRGKNCKTVCRTCLPFATSKRRYSKAVTAVLGTTRAATSVHTNLGFFPDARFVKIAWNPIEVKIKAGRKTAAVNDEQHFIFVGRPSEEKGFFFIIDVLKSLPNPNWKLSVFGSRSNDYRDFDPRIVFRGFQPIDIIYQEPNGIVLVPSLWREPFSRVVAEAVSWGSHVVASDLAGPAEILDKLEIGTLVKAGDFVAWKAALSNLVLENNADVETSIPQSFSPHNISNTVIRAYETLIKLSSHPAGPCK